MAYFMCGTFSSENGQTEVVLGALLNRLICSNRRQNIFGRLVRANNLCSMNQFQSTLKMILVQHTEHDLALSLLFRPLEQCNINLLT